MHPQRHPVFIKASAWRTDPPEGIEEALNACLAALPRAARKAAPVFFATILDHWILREQHIRQAGMEEGTSLPPVPSWTSCVIENGWDPSAVMPVNAACASGAVAVGLATLRARSTNVEGSVAVAIESHSELLMSGFRSLRILDPGVPQPYTEKACGFRCAAGAAAAWLQQHDQGPGIAVTGVGITNDAHHPTGPDQEGRGLQRAIRRCLDDAGVSAEEVESIKLNAVGTPYSDASEYQGLRAIFGHRLESLPAYFLKPYLGHAQGAIGLIETLVAARHLEEGVVPSVETSVVHEKIFPFNLCDQPRPLSPRNVLLIFSGLSGQQACLLLERVP